MYPKNILLLLLFSLDENFNILIKAGFIRLTFFSGAIVNREFCHVYLLESNIPLELYTLQASEVTGLIQMDLYEGMKLFTGEVETVTVSGIQIDEKGIKHVIETTISKEDIVHRVDGYYMNIFIMAERYFEVKRYLSI